MDCRHSVGGWSRHRRHSHRLESSLGSAHDPIQITDSAHLVTRTATNHKTHCWSNSGYYYRFYPARKYPCHTQLPVQSPTVIHRLSRLVGWGIHVVPGM